MRVSSAEIHETGFAHLDWCLECDPDDTLGAYHHEVYGVSADD